ncbi:uncharacterized protein BJ171DRAFT_485022 [Polychytrium aggregatum]|uniref:uncharacterized protein n=1 Tax=Polychytrium aggregatum TaxID=110093 RepID=UPI0022FEF728|nr:uncharacterized protein BJ171DRAFT_485022 [Polychytrium aggregatum]KAI9209783.1 hypothetical protein BJ171DRAFT_485022 [Polychytrium aggregatum]
MFAGLGGQASWMVVNARPGFCSLVFFRSSEAIWDSILSSIVRICERMATTDSRSPSSLGSASTASRHFTLDTASSILTFPTGLSASWQIVPASAVIRNDSWVVALNSSTNATPLPMLRDADLRGSFRKALFFSSSLGFTVPKSQLPWAVAATVSFLDASKP